MCKKTAFFLLIFFFFTTAVQAFETVRVLFHVHTQCSDGGMGLEEIKGYALRHWYRAVFITDHSNSIADANAANFELCRFPDYRKNVEALNEEKFIAVTGLEITVSLNTNSLCHANKFSDVKNPYLFEAGRFDSAYPRGFIEEICEPEEAICCLNHLKDCPQWHNWIGDFGCMELMNDIGNDLKDEPGHSMQLSSYMETLRNGEYVYVVGGADLHNKFQDKATGEIATEVFPDRFSRESLISAIKEGRTIATKDFWIEYISDYPSKNIKKLEGKTARIEIKYIVKDKGKEPQFRVFENGDDSIFRVVRTKRVSSREGYTTYEASFSESIPLSDKPTCFVINVDQHMISSPYCYIPTE